MHCGTLFISINCVFFFLSMFLPIFYKTKFRRSYCSNRFVTDSRDTHSPKNHENATTPKWLVLPLSNISLFSSLFGKDITHQMRKYVTTVCCLSCSYFVFQATVYFLINLGWNGKGSGSQVIEHSSWILVVYQITQGDEKTWQIEALRQISGWDTFLLCIT